jgi:predicted ATPase
MSTATEMNREVADREHAKPPFLRRVRIRGYKSIEFCDVTLEPLTVLVGRNASGKSNFLDALAFLRDLMNQGATWAVTEHGGDSAFSRLTTDKAVAFEVQTEFPSHRTQCRALYRIELVPTGHRDAEVRHESLQLVDTTRDIECRFWADRGNVRWQGLEAFAREFDPQRVGGLPNGAVRSEYPSIFAKYRPDRPLLGVIGHQPFIDLSGRLQNLECYNFYPPAIRELHRSFGSPVLERDGWNLARAIEGLAELDPDGISRIKSYLNAIVDEVVGFEVVQLSDYETIRFRVRAQPFGQPLQLDAASMSDGTLRVLASLVAAFQLQIPVETGLVAIEEPETALHPAAMRALVDALDEATSRNQILLTTHSADMLDNPTIQPENVRVVQMADGRTEIGPVDAASVEIVKRQLNTLGGLERENRLEPDLDDLNRQRQLAASTAEPLG